MNTIPSLVLGAAVTIAGLIWGYIKRGRAISDLKTDLAIQPGQIEIKRLGDEVNETSKDADIKASDFDHLKQSNAELAAKLGISSGGTDKPDAG